MNRMETFRADSQECVKSEVLDVSSNFAFSDFSFHRDENTLTFKWTSLCTKNTCLLTYIGSEDYPDNCYLHRHWEKSDVQDSALYNVPLLELVRILGKELHAIEQSQMAAVNAGQAETKEDGGGDGTETMETSPADLTASMAAAAVHGGSDYEENSDLEYLDCESGMSDDADDNYDFDPSDLYGDSEDSGETMDFHTLRGVHPLLKQDMQMFQQLLEPSEMVKKKTRPTLPGKTETTRVLPMLSFRLLDSLGEVDCDIHIPLNNLNLSPQLADAWKIDLNEPLVVRVNLSATCYLDNPDPPKVEVFQPKRKECGIGIQLKNIIKLFIGDHWQKVDNRFLQSNLKKSGSMPCDLSSASGPSSPEEKERAFQHLLEMGFEEEESWNALQVCKHNLMEACVMLSNKITSCDTEEAKVLSSQDKYDNAGVEYRGKDAESRTSPSKCNTSKKRHLSTPVKLRTKKGDTVVRSLSTSHTEPNIAEASENPLRLQEMSYLDAKRTPSFEDGFLVMLYRYVRQRVPTVNEFCVVCDRPHVFQSSGAMLMPSVCSRELCLFSFQTLGVMADATADIATGADVVDLLITMAKAACFSPRQATIFSPFPCIVDPDNPEPGKLALSDKAKDYHRVETLLRQLPPMRTLLVSSCTNLQKILNEKDRLLYPLLSWIIYSNRSHIVKLPPEKQLGMMATSHQFLLLSSPPAQERVFQEAKAQYGSTFAFHGSGIENWHSIIRKGLVVASGTKYQLNGAAHGRGIYLSPSAGVSSAYSRMGHGYHVIKPALKQGPQSSMRGRFLQGKNVSCLALCEVINSPSLLRKTSSIWVCTNESHVCTRFFFVFEDGQANSTDVDMTIGRYKAMVEKALANCFMAVVPKLSQEEKVYPAHRLTLS